MSFLERKHLAVDKFKERLLQSSVGDKIARIILFGSLLRMDAGEESDVDLLIVATSDLKRVEETTSEISFDILLEMGQGGREGKIIHLCALCLPRLPRSSGRWYWGRSGRSY